MKPFLTIFTPTYNRGQLLKRLYEKLCEQSCKDFFWLIVDDGSSDETKTIVESFIKEEKLLIKYYYQPNGGKQKAVITALKLCETECFAFCDSDDWYLENTVLNFKKDYVKIKDNDKICGIVARRGNQDKEFKHFKKIKCERMVLKLPVLYTKYKFHAETCAMFKTEMLKQANYPDIEQKFIPESYMFDKLSQKYEVLFINKPYSVTEYLADGYTVQSNKLYHDNPLGVYYALREALYTKYGFFKNIKNGISLLCWCKLYNFKTNFWRIDDLYKIPFCYIGYVICLMLKKPSWIWSK